MKYEIELHVLECANCSMTFAITKFFENARRSDRGTFYCPSGHNNYYPQKNELEQLKEKLAVAKRDNEYFSKLSEQAEKDKAAMERSLQATRGHLTRAKNQLVKGNCPNCEEHFEDLKTHIAAKHPEFDLELTKEPEVKAVKPAAKKRGRPAGSKKSILTKELPKTRKERLEYFKKEFAGD